MRSADKPADFVYLRDVDPTIEQDMRYAGPHNFTGKPVPGYDAPECMLVREAADALRGVQAELKPMGLTLRVYDCYRPARAVAAFVQWSKEPDEHQAKREHYPNLSKDALFPDYIATRSGHSRGATLDVTIAPLGENTDSLEDSLDMGTGFDMFDPKSHTHAPGLTPDQRRNRTLLIDIMSRHGFKNYPREIWHFTFEPEPHPDTSFDFPIRPRTNGEDR